MDLLASRASRLAEGGEEELGRGKRQRHQVFSNLNQKNLEASGANADGASGAHQDAPVRHCCNVCDGDDDEESMLRCGGCTARAHVLCLGMGEEHPAAGRGGCGDGECAEVGAPLDAKRPTPPLSTTPDRGDVELHPADIAGEDDDVKDEDYDHADEDADDDDDDDDDADFHIASLPVGSKRRKGGAVGKAADATADAFGSIARAAGEANAAAAGVGVGVVRFVPTETAIIGAAAKQMARVRSAAVQAQERLDRAKTLADPTKDDFNYLGLAEDTLTAILKEAARGDSHTEEELLPLDMFLPMRASSRGDTTRTSSRGDAPSPSRCFEKSLTAEHAEAARRALAGSLETNRLEGLYVANRARAKEAERSLAMMRILTPGQRAAKFSVRVLSATGRKISTRTVENFMISTQPPRTTWVDAKGQPLLRRLCDAYSHSLGMDCSIECPTIPSSLPPSSPGSRATGRRPRSSPSLEPV